MSKSPKLYSRLTPPAGGVGTYSTLWMAADHLLMVQSTGFTEDYARVWFRDIKGFFVVKSERQFWWGVMWGGFVLVSLLVSIVATFRGVWVVRVFLLLPSVVGFAWNLLLGATCRVFVVTHVQTARLPSIVRRRKAQKLLARLEPLIRSQQPVPVAPPPPTLPGVAPETPVAPPSPA
jgi:hypothetical protein